VDEIYAGGGGGNFGEGEILCGIVRDVRKRRAEKWWNAGGCGGACCVAEKIAAEMEIGAHRLFRIRGVCMRDANPVISETGMQIWRLDFGHVAAYAISCSNGTGKAGMIFGFFFCGACGVASEAVCVVGTDVVRERLVGIVAGDAGDAGVALCPALAVFETVRCEAHVEHASANAEHLTGDDVLPRAMAGAAEIHVIDASELGGIEDKPTASLFHFGARSGDMCGTGAVAGFAGDAGVGSARIELIFCGGGGGVAAEAEAGFVGRDGAACGIGESCGDGAQLAGSDVESLRGVVETNVALVKLGALLIEKSLAHVAGAESPS